jgi:hypothetical protein
MPTKYEDGQKDALALAVARGRTPTAAAKALGIAERSARRWAADPEFRRLVLALHNQILARAAGRLATLSTKAVRTLGKLLDSQDEEVRYKAARAILADAVAVMEPVRAIERAAILEAGVSADVDSPWRP